MFEALKYKDYRWIWTGQTAHAFTLWAQMIALPLLVLEITDNSAAQLGGVIAMRTVPTLFLSPAAGVVADWFDRRKVLMATKWSNLALSVVIAWLVVAGQVQLWHLYLWMFLLGATQVFDQPARFSMIPSVLPRELVTQGMALLSSTQNIMRIVGAAGAGVIAEYLGLGWTFTIISIAATASLYATFRLHVEANRRAGAAGFRGMTAGLVEGAKYAVSDPTIRGVLVVSLVYFTFGMSFMQVFAPLFAVEVLEIGRDGLGLLFALTGAGALAASLLIARLRPARLGLVLPLTVTAMGASLMLFAATSYFEPPAGVIVPLAVATLVGAAQTSFMALSRAVMMQSAPDEMRGRVLAFISVDRAMIAGGVALGGVLSAVYGVQPTQLAFGAICFAGSLVVFAAMSGLRSFSTAPAPPAPARSAG